MKLRKRYFLAGAIILIIAISIGVVISARNRGQSCIGSKSDNYFILPPSATEIEQHSLELTRSCTLWIKFHIAPTDLDGFINTTLIKQKLTSTSMPTSIGGTAFLQQETGWSLNSVNFYLAAESKGTGERYLDEQFVVVDTGNSAEYTVYIVTKMNWL